LGVVAPEKKKKKERKGKKNGEGEQVESEYTQRIFFPFAVLWDQCCGD